MSYLVRCGGLWWIRYYTTNFLLKRQIFNVYRLMNYLENNCHFKTYIFFLNLSCPWHMKPSLQQRINSFYIQSWKNLKNYTYMYVIYGTVRRTLLNTVSYDQLSVWKDNFLTFTMIVIFITYIMFPTNAITKMYEYPEFITGARRN